MNTATTGGADDSVSRGQNSRATGCRGKKIGSCRGVALIVSLIILAILALLGISAITATTSELQVASDLEAEARSFQAAEAGITAASTLVFADADTLAFQGNSAVLDFSSLASNPLADLGSDTPVVTAVISGDPSGRCERSEFASSDDIVGCGAFDVVSTHAPQDIRQARNAASTTLRLGISRQVIKLN